MLWISCKLPNYLEDADFTVDIGRVHGLADGFFVIFVKD